MESRGRIENVQELKSNILGFLEQDPEDATLSGFLNEIALYTDLDSVEASDDCVTMMTIHSAKGLEFPVVYVVGMEEGIFPGASAQYDEEELEEERRLCYVAMTRAKEKLTLTNCPAADALRPHQRQPALPVPGRDPGGEHALGEQAGAPFRRYGARRHLRRRPVRGRLGQLPRPRRRLLEQRRRPQLPGPGPGAPAAPGLCPAGVLHPEERPPRRRLCCSYSRGTWWSTPPSERAWCSPSGPWAATPWWKWPLTHVGNKKLMLKSAGAHMRKL